MLVIFELLLALVVLIFDFLCFLHELLAFEIASLTQAR